MSFGVVPHLPLVWSCATDLPQSLPGVARGGLLLSVPGGGPCPCLITSFQLKILKEKSLHEYTVQIERAQFSLQNLNGQLKLERKGRMEVNNQQLTGHNMQVS